MEIFRQIPPPTRQARNRVNQYAKWYTWSDEFRTLLKPLSRELRNLRSPTSTHLLGGKEYDDTFSVALGSLSDRGLARQFKHFAKSLYDLDVANRLMLFTNMLDDELDGSNLRRLFGLLRDALVSLSGDSLAAMCQPIKAQKVGKDFPLHSDLYIPVILFNIFQDVPNDARGSSLFLPVTEVVNLLRTIKTLPPETRSRIIENLTNTHRDDRYEESFQLIHGGHAWTDELEHRMQQRQLRIKLYSGQGYMLHDRRWLHGRDNVNGRLTHKRLHRLIFNNRKAQLARQKQSRRGV